MYKKRQNGSSGFQRSSSVDEFPTHDSSEPRHTHHSEDEYESNPRTQRHKKEKTPKKSKGKKDKSYSGRIEKRKGDPDGGRSSRTSSLEGKNKVEGFPNGREGAGIADGTTRGNPSIDGTARRSPSLDGTIRGSTVSVDLSRSPSRAASEAISGVGRKMTTQTYELQASSRSKVPTCVFWKYIFYFGLVIFGAIIGVVAFTFYNKGRQNLVIHIIVV